MSFIKQRIEGVNPETVQILDTKLKAHRDIFDAYKKAATMLHARSLASRSCINVDAILKFQEVDVEHNQYDDIIALELLQLNSMQRDTMAIQIRSGSGTIISAKDFAHNSYWM